MKTTKLFLLLLPFYNCGIYSFTGSSLTSDVKTISIQTFFNNAPLGPPNISNIFTEKIKDYFQKNTNLVLVSENGDLQFEGHIENYTITPVAANANSSNDGDFSQYSRLTITVFVSYFNSKDGTFDFEKQFSFFKDFDQNLDLNANETDFINEISDQIIIDIFNASVANW